MIRRKSICGQIDVDFLKQVVYKFFQATESSSALSFAENKFLNNAKGFSKGEQH
jgi:hypothetical protein